jgi:serine/threonine protein kinase
VATRPIPEPIRSRVQHQGWIPLEFLGEGGGAIVYLCAKRELIQTIQDLMQQAGTAIREVQGDVEIACKMVQKLNVNLVAERNALSALKIPKSLDDPATFERLRREIAAMSAVKHPALIRLFDADKNDPPEWFVMELHQKGNLSGLAKEYQGRVVQTIEAILPITEALALLHKNGFVHRDIKPSNIFISDQGSLVLGDFGIVFPRESDGTRLTDVATTLFSRDWIPDWARFSETPPQPKIDVFMLGKVIYFMVTGGQKVLASQLDEEAFDLNHQLKGQEGAAELQNLLIECITTKEKDCKFDGASNFLIRLQELLNHLTGRVQGNVIFSFLSVHSTTHVPIQRDLVIENPRYPSLARLQVFFSTKYKTLRGRARLAGPPKSERFVLFLLIDGVHLTTSSGYTFEMTPNHEMGSWSPEIIVTLSIPLDRGWHNMDIIITSESGSYTLTGFMLYGR